MGTTWGPGFALPRCDLNPVTYLPEPHEELLFPAVPSSRSCTFMCRMQSRENWTGNGHACFPAAVCP